LNPEPADSDYSVCRLLSPVVETIAPQRDP
jgi:hypothetical protein